MRRATARRTTTHAEVGALTGQPLAADTRTKLRDLVIVDVEVHRDGHPAV
jgi:hypothetical protein